MTPRADADPTLKRRCPAEPSGCPAEHKAGSLTRRSLLSASLGAGLAAAGSGRGYAAAAIGVPFGAAMQSEIFDSDPGYVQAYVEECDLILPMNELKFGSLRPRQDTYSFHGSDLILDFAARHGRTSRGHTFVWWNALPDWLGAIDTAQGAERELVSHIETVMDRYRGRLQSFDVVNEAIAHDPKPGAPLRDSYWLRTLGPRHIPVAFSAAARADPSARLVLNDYDLEFRGPRYDARRALVLSLVRKLQDAQVRVDAVGIQGHLYAELAIDIDAVARFAGTLKSMGVGMIVTELDVIDWKIPGGPAEQDAAAARIVGDLLDAVFAAGAPEAVIAWGITDRYSWISDTMPRRDGKPSRPLPLDARLRRKPWYGQLRDRLRSGA